MKQIVGLVLILCCTQMVAQEVFPDGKAIPEWFRENKEVNVNALGKKYSITNYGVVNDSTVVQTKKIQEVIDLAAQNGGGVIVVPQGTFLSGSLFFKNNTHLYLEENAVLKGSDDISHFPVKMTRMEGQTLNYFMALVNADGLDGFTISGKGTLNGNGLRYWKSFWLRRSINPDCTNMEEMRPRIIYMSNCKNVQIEGIRIMDSPFWSTHFYKCSFLKLLNLRITSPASPVKAPSTDAVDLDVCNNVLIKNCYMSVNDDAVALKGGKGPWADKDDNNGENYNIIIEDCTFGFCHGVLTCGSESIYNHNIILRRCNLDQAKRLLWLKMRPDTPQQYKYILVEDIKGNVRNCIFIAPWTQFYDLKDRKDMPVSYSSYITMRNIHLDCDSFFAVEKSKQYKLSNFCFDNLTITAKKDVKIDEDIIDALVMRKVEINKVN